MDTTLTETQLQAIEARAHAATPGEWLGIVDRLMSDDPVELGIYFGWGRVAELTEADQTFIAATRTDVPALLAALREARHVARLAHDFIQEGCFGDELTLGDPGTPEFDLYVRWMAYRHVSDDCPWLKEAE